MSSESGDVPKEIKSWIAALTAKHEEYYHFAQDLSAAEFHWFFVQGVQAIRGGLFVPGLLSLLSGVEASIRITLVQLSERKWPHDVLSPYKVLSNVLIRKARDCGMPVQCLAMPDEDDFFEKLDSGKSSRKDVEIVRLRKNICHGNVLEFINRELGDDEKFFTPECLRDVSEKVITVCYNWTKALGSFRRTEFA